MTNERKDTIAKQREPHIWMGRDNEFKKQARNQESALKKGYLDLQADAEAQREAANKLRKHNFTLGFHKGGMAGPDNQQNEQ